MFERISNWVAVKAIRISQAYGRHMLRQERTWELQLRKDGRFDDANRMREAADDLERLIEHGFELAPC